MSQHSLCNYELQVEVRLYGHWDIPLFEGGQSIPWIVISSWPSEWAYYCIYTQACFSHVSGITGLVLNYTRSTFCLPAGY